MKTLQPPKLNTLCAVAAVLSGAFPTAGLAAMNTALADTFYANYPAACGGEPVATGLCLLGSTSPPATGDFIARQRLGGGHDVDYPVQLNVGKALPSGNYLLYRANGLDDRHETRFTVTAGQVYTLKTATLKFQDTAGHYNKLQHFQAPDGVNGEGCRAEIGNKGVQAYLPGNYIVSLVPTLDNTTPRCEHGGIAFNVMAGQGLNIHPGTLTPQTLSAANTYLHSSKGISLTNIDPLRHDVSQVGFLSNFRSFQNIYNPSSAAVDTLVLSGAPHFHFVIPVKMNATAACGLSLAAGGLPAHNLMTDCVFDNEGKLTRFRVNAGAYYGFDDIHGKSAVASHTINSPFIVSGVKFNLKGN